MTHNVHAISQVGQMVAEKYRLSRVLGVGGMGAVYEALHTVTHRKVAIKILHRFVHPLSPAATRFMREAQAAASIGHPAIVDVLDAGQLPDGSLYLVFELLEGEDLESALALRKVPRTEVVKIGIAVLDALAAAHAHGFIHRDIKPANVFLATNRGERQVKLLDFGIAKRLGNASHPDITAQGSIVGTLEYMSPEQAKGEGIDARTDLWSVGAMLYRAFAGVPPFLANNQLNLVKKILHDPLPALADLCPTLPRSLTTIVHRALERDLVMRWGSAIAMREALRSCELGPANEGAVIALEVRPLPSSRRNEGTELVRIRLPDSDTYASRAVEVVDPSGRRVAPTLEIVDPGGEHAPLPTSGVRRAPPRLTPVPAPEPPAAPHSEDPEGKTVRATTPSMETLAADARARAASHVAFDEIDGDPTEPELEESVGRYAQVIPLVEEIVRIDAPIRPQLLVAAATPRPCVTPVAIELPDEPQPWRWTPMILLAMVIGVGLACAAWYARAPGHTLRFSDAPVRVEMPESVPAPSVDTRAPASRASTKEARDPGAPSVTSRAVAADPRPPSTASEGRAKSKPRIRARPKRAPPPVPAKPAPVEKSDPNQIERVFR